MEASPLTTALSEQGVSLWLDDLSRHRLTSGGLEDLMAKRSIVGVTTNPSIFQAAIAGSEDYDAQLDELAADGVDVEAALTRMTTDDVRAACDLFTAVYESTDGVDGRVSIEVDPRLAHDTEATVAQALELHRIVGRENVMIKIPATDEGLPAITRVLAEGISVNVTLIFSLARYREVIDAFASGLGAARGAGRDISRIHSVASFFVSRVDSEIDARLEEIGGDALELRGKAGIANARLAFAEFTRSLSTEPLASLIADGAHVQRLLWASTGVKNPDYPDTMYVDRLVGSPVVNTVPEKTLEAVADHARLDERMDGDGSAVAAVLDQVAAAGVDLDDVFAVLEAEGVSKFETAWNELLDTVGTSLASRS
ncbi:MAG: transaldolase [Dermabacter sp.]|nr:transaldolase [Dermabacter sp.]